VLLCINTQVLVRLEDAVLCMLTENESGSQEAGSGDPEVAGFANEHIMRRTNRLCSLQALPTIGSLSF